MNSSNILSCLSNPNKTEDDIRIAHEWFKRNTEVFKSLSAETMADILNSAKIIEKYPNEIIIRQGDIGDCFYVLLYGSASLYISNDVSSLVKEEQPERLTASFHSKLIRSARSENAQRMKLESKKLVKDNDRKNYGEYISNYNEGGCFGELALIQEESIRNASIIADDKCHLLSISKDMFNKAIRAYSEMQYKEKLTFVNGHILFKTWLPRTQKQLAMSLVRTNFLFDQDIVVQSQRCSGLKFLKRGNAKVVIDMKQHLNQYCTYVAQMEFRDSPMQNTTTVPSRDDLKTARSTREIGPRIKRDKIEIAIIGDNDVIGDIEFGFDFPTNLLTVTAVETCEVYVLENVHVERMINMKRNVSTLDILDDFAELKLSTYHKRFSSFGELPLFKLFLDEINSPDEMMSLTNRIEKQLIKPSLLPVFKAGPVIDFFGPGSVFFRNRLKRKTVRERLTKSQREDLDDKRIQKMYSVQISTTNSQNATEVDLEPRKSIFHSKQKENAFLDWETSSIHLNDLERRMQSWMSTLRNYRPARATTATDREVFRLPRFQNNELPEDCRFIVKYKRAQNENDRVESRTTGRKDEDSNPIEIGKKNENLIRQYTEMEYIKLKQEMRIKEKRLSIFRLKHAL